jgi:hypothetical protein
MAAPVVAGFIARIIQQNTPPFPLLAAGRAPAKF